MRGSAHTFGAGGVSAIYDAGYDLGWQDASEGCEAELVRLRQEIAWVRGQLQTSRREAQLARHKAAEYAAALWATQNVSVSVNGNGNGKPRV